MLAGDSLSVRASELWAGGKKQSLALKGEIDLIRAAVAATSSFNTSRSPERR